MAENSVSLLHANHRSRMRNRFLVTGGSGFAEHELLEMLLFYAVPRVDTNPLAHELLDYFGDLDNLLCASADDITKVKGAGESVAVLIKLVEKISSVCNDYQRKSNIMSDYDDIGRYLVSEFKKVKTEKVFLMLFDGKNNVLHCEFIADGDFSSVMMDFRKIASLVLLKNAAKVVIAHNHTDGDPNPSIGDKGTTGTLVAFLRDLNVELREHYIISDNVYIGLNHIRYESF